MHISHNEAIAHNLIQGIYKDNILDEVTKGITQSYLESKLMQEKRF